MRRLSLAMMGLAIAGLMTMVSCRKPVNQFNTTGEKITFSATTENNSKTYAEEIGGELYVKWEKGDDININGNVFTLVGNGGGTTGSFTGNVEEEAGYFASYPAANDGSIVTFTVPNEQTDYNNSSDVHALTGVLPMAAYTKEKGGNLAFKNMVNILQLNLTGNQIINEIEVSSTAENLSGTFTVSTNLTPNHITSGTKKITVTKNITLTATPQTVYVVLPVFGSAESTVTIKFTGDDGVMTVGPKALAGSNTPNHRYSAGVNVLLETPWSASVETIPVCARHSTCASSGGVVTGTGVEEQGVCWGTSANPTIAGSHYVHQYEYATGSLTPKNTTTNNTFTGFIGGSPDSENRLTPGTTYHVRAYIRKGSQVVYGNDITFPTLASESIQYVDLGLSVKWAKCNLGATTPDGNGDYYQWGDLAACTGTTSGKMVDCGWQSYRYAANSTSTFTKYCSSGKTSYWYNYVASTNEPDNKLQLELTDDCVSQTLGGGWRMPTEAEFNELISNTTITWKDANESITIGVNPVSMPVAGRYFVSNKVGYTDKYIFLPAAGYRTGTSHKFAGTNGSPWSSSLYASYPILSRDLLFGPKNFEIYNDYRCNGLSVRPVKDK